MKPTSVFTDYILVWLKCKTCTILDLCPRRIYKVETDTQRGLFIQPCVMLSNIDYDL